MKGRLILLEQREFLSITKRSHVLLLAENICYTKSPVQLQGARIRRYVTTIFVLICDISVKHISLNTPTYIFRDAKDQARRKKRSRSQATQRNRPFVACGQSLGQIFVKCFHLFPFRRILRTCKRTPAFPFFL